MNKLLELGLTEKLFFSAQDLMVIWGYEDERKLYELIKYYVASRDLFRLARGLYSLKNYSEQDLRGNQSLLDAISNKLVPNSYVSMYTVLGREGIIHQYYDAIYAVASRRVTRTVGNIKFEYYRVRDKILFEDWGIEADNGIRVASKERAILDTYYCLPDLNLEFQRGVKWDELVKGAKIYGKKDILAKVKGLKEEYVSNNR